MVSKTWNVRNGTMAATNNARELYAEPQYRHVAEQTKKNGFELSVVVISDLVIRSHSL